MDQSQSRNISVKEDAVSHQPIAVFDSGLGGLSVVRHLRRSIPHENIVYFGDTARVPYGTKSKPTIVRFAIENARYLLQFDPKLIAVACNTASALALEEVAEAVPVPVVGVLEPGARAAARFADGRAVAILGTQATIESGAYTTALHRYSPNVRVVPCACGLFVPLVEEGFTNPDDLLVADAVSRYLTGLKNEDVGVAVLACTHYPLLREAIASVLGPAVNIVDSGREASLAIRETLEECGSLCRGPQPGSIRFFVSDNPDRFRKIGSRFLNESIDDVQLVLPEQYVTAAMSPTGVE